MYVGLPETELVVQLPDLAVSLLDVPGLAVRVRDLGNTVSFQNLMFVFAA